MLEVDDLAAWLLCRRLDGGRDVERRLERGVIGEMGESGGSGDKGWMVWLVGKDRVGMDGEGRCFNVLCVEKESERRKEGSRGSLPLPVAALATCEWYSSSERSRSPSSSNQRKLS